MTYRLTKVAGFVASFAYVVLLGVSDGWAQARQPATETPNNKIKRLERTIQQLTAENAELRKKLDEQQKQVAANTPTELQRKLDERQKLISATGEMLGAVAKALADRQDAGTVRSAAMKLLVVSEMLRGNLQIEPAESRIRVNMDQWIALRTNEQRRNWLAMIVVVTEASGQKLDPGAGFGLLVTSLDGKHELAVWNSEGIRWIYPQ